MKANSYSLTHVVTTMLLTALLLASFATFGVAQAQTTPSSGTSSGSSDYSVDTIPSTIAVDDRTVTITVRYRQCGTAMYDVSTVNWGDGDTSTLNVNRIEICNTSLTTESSHTYDEDDTYTITLRDTSGNVVETLTVDVENDSGATTPNSGSTTDDGDMDDGTSPSMDVSGDTVTVTVGLHQCNTPFADVDTITWGDGDQSTLLPDAAQEKCVTGGTPTKRSHSYSKDGTYTVKVLAGGTAVKTWTVEVEDDEITGGPNTPVSSDDDGQTIADMQQTIKDLQKRLSDLMKAMNGTPNTSAQLGSKPWCSYTWTRSLRVGDEGSDVRVLQQFLNSNTFTQVSVSGDGAAGFETTYFGQKTAEALIRFQELHAADILFPAGLTRGTGFFGSLTQNKIKSMCN